MEAADSVGEALVALATDRCLAPGDGTYFRAALLNYLGVTLGGRREPEVERFVRSRSALSPGTHAPLGGSDSLVLSDCVMADCYASSVAAFDDIHFATTCHPAGPVASAIMGLARLQDVSMGDAVEALAVGMEVQCRLGLALFSGKTGSAAGWYTTGVVGGVGAAAAVGRLLGFDRAHMASALGWAAAAACGLRGTHGSAAGTFVPALAARAGFEAALLARDGLSCPIAALVGANGLIRTVAPMPALERALEGVGDTWVSCETSPKPYPFGFVAFAAVDCALGLADGLDAVSDIRSLEVSVSARAARLGANPLPVSRDEAIVSIPYVVARTLADRSSVGRPLPSPFRMGPRERQILSACHLVADPVLDDEQARISVNGGELEAACEACRGSVSRPLTVPEVIDKFRLVAGLDDPEAFARQIMIGDGDIGELLHVR